jgi:hypothetical protein
VGNLTSKQKSKEKESRGQANMDKHKADLNLDGSFYLFYSISACRPASDSLRQCNFRAGQLDYLHRANWFCSTAGLTIRKAAGGRMDVLVCLSVCVCVWEEGLKR